MMYKWETAEETMKSKWKLGHVERKIVFKHVRIQNVRIHPAHAQSLIRAFALRWNIL